MAELPRYNRMGIMHADLPGISTAGLEEGIRYQSNIGEKLDQLMAVVTERGTEMAQEQALEYAANNPVTQEQIDDAMAESGGTSFWDAITGGNIYDDTLKAAQGTMLANQLSSEAQKKFSQLKLLSDSGQMDYATAQAEVADIIDGYAVTIAAFDPKASIKARASMATVANSALTSIADNEIKAGQAALAFQLNENIDTFTRAAEDMAFAGDTYDPASGRVITAEEKIRIAANPVLEQALATGNYKKVEAIRTRMNEAIVNGVAKGAMESSFASNASQGFSRLSKGDLGKYQGTWDSMTDSERNDVKKAYLGNIADQKKLLDDADKVDKENLMNQSYKLQDEAIDAPLERRMEIKRELQAINAQMGIKFNTDKYLSELDDVDFGGDSDNEKMMYLLEGRVDAGTITDAGIMSRAEAGDITYKEARVLQNRKKAMESKDLRSALKLVDDGLTASRGKYQRSSEIQPAKSQTKLELIEQFLDPENKQSAREIANRLVEENRKNINEKRAETAMSNLAKLLARNDYLLESEDVEAVDRFIDMMKDNPTLLDDKVFMERFEFTAGELGAIKRYIKQMGEL